MRYLSSLLICLLLCLPLCAAADDNGYSVFFEDFSAQSSGKPEILYIGKTQVSLTMRSRPDKSSEGLGVVAAKKKVQIWGYDTQWLFCWDDEVGIYYLRRTQSIDPIEPANPDVTRPYGVIENRYVAVTAADTVLRAAPDQSAEMIDQYPKDTRLSIWAIQDGWALIPYKRIVGYLYVGDLKDLTPVVSDPSYAEDGDILAAYTTYYSVKKTELNIGRMENIRVGCLYIDQVYQPGDVFSFNAIAGPYRASRGYQPSPVLVDGGTVAGYGGGTCQVSTTLYNALLQQPQYLTVLHRRPHGPGGASYAPHGVDAAVGTDYLDLRFRNDYDFPITIDSTVQNGALCICVRKGVYVSEPEENQKK